MGKVVESEDIEGNDDSDVKFSAVHYIREMRNTLTIKTETIETRTSKITRI